MSALNFYHQGHRAIILQDAACYDDDGIILSLQSKHVILPEAGVVVACTGMSNASQFMAIIVRRRFADIDDLANQGGAFFRRHWNELQGTADELGSGKICAMIVGWSKRDQRPKSVHFTNVGGEQTFVVDLAWFHHPALRDDAKASLACQIGEPTREEFDPVQHGLALLETQRRQVTVAGDPRPAGQHLIGGHVTLITVDRHGVTERTLRRWDDRVGEKINPGPLSVPATGVVVPMVAMNRKERRRQASLGQRAVA